VIASFTIHREYEDEAKYPMFSRLSVATGDFTNTIMALLKLFGWKNVCYISQTTPDTDDLHDSFVSSAGQERITIANKH
jgi:hypothetical protein